MVCTNLELGSLVDKMDGVIGKGGLLRDRCDSILVCTLICEKNCELAVAFGLGL